MALRSVVSQEIVRLTNTDSPAASAGVAVGKPLQADPSSVSSFDQYRTWLKACVDTHSECPGNELVDLPHRVLEVMSDAGEPCLRLIETHQRKGRYTALSHCWGTFGGLQTLKSCLDSHLIRIDKKDLSKTVHDAVIITRGLDLRFLWLDTLCIIQDDSEDWKRESSKMGSIYRQAHVTIAASGAQNGSEGCFFTRRSVPDPVAIPVTFPPRKELTEINFKMHAGSVADGLMDNPLSKRGWCLQELILSRRIINFGRDRVIWRCKEVLAAEDYANLRQSQEGILDHRLQLQSHPLQGSGRYSWFAVIQDYTRRKLTKESDKLYAIDGLANLFRSSINGPYCYGLWLRHIHEGLLWMSSDGQMQRPRLRRAPSWSWASLDGAINHLHTLQPKTNDVYSTAQIVQFAGGEPDLIRTTHIVEPSSDGMLVLCTKTRGVNRSDHIVVASEFADLSSKALVNLLYDNRDIQCHALLDPGTDDEFCGWAAFDEESFTEEAMLCIMVSEVRRGSAFQAYNVLILGLAEESLGPYRRLGVGEVTKKEWFGDVPARRITVL